tara:strand:+ start:115 stop:834 length:720 start_codon:yes stop_codon:yes gene_type:complete
MKASLIVYTHSDVADCTEVFFKEMDQYISDRKKILFIDKNIPNIPSDYDIKYYNDSENYNKRLIECLTSIEDEFVFFHHEDMFLYDTPDLKKVDEYTTKLKNEDDKHFIKLITGGNGIARKDVDYPELIHCDGTFDYIFSIQPTIWKRSSLIDLLKFTPGNTIWEIELNAQQYCRSNKIFGYSVFDGSKKRGMSHWDNNVYPYIATAVVKGKWNMSEYEAELGNILERNGIDKDVRGYV